MVSKLMHLDIPIYLEDFEQGKVRKHSLGKYQCQYRKILRQRGFQAENMQKTDGVKFMYNFYNS